MLDIGHFIKCMCNVFHAFKHKNSEFSGVNLLDPNRTRAIYSDASRHLKSYNKLDKRNSNSEYFLSLQNKYLQRAKSIMSQNCGNHLHCKASHI